MPPERFPPDDPREWLNRARSNLAQAKTRLLFPYVHNLARLLTLLEANEAVPDSIMQAERLSRFAVEGRYPGLGRQVTEEEYQELIAIAEAVVRWAEDRVRDTP